MTVVDPGQLRRLIARAIEGRPVLPGSTSLWVESDIPLSPDMGADRATIAGTLFSVDTRGPVGHDSHTGRSSSIVRHGIILHANYPLEGLLDPDGRNIATDNALRAAKNLCRLVYRGCIGDVTVEDEFAYGWSPVAPDLVGLTATMTLKYEQEM